MAQQTDKQKQLAGLILQAEASRLALTEAQARLRHRLDLPARIKSTVASSPSKWLGGALFAGLATSFLFRSRKRKEVDIEKKAKRPQGFVFGLLSFLFNLAKPSLKIYATKLLKDYLAGRFMTDSQSRQESMRTPPY